MAHDVFDPISKISSVLGLWTIAAIVTFLIILGRRIYYVIHLRTARREARKRIQGIQNEIQSLRSLKSGLDGAISQPLHTSIEDREKRLRILSQTEDSLWMRFFAFFRADPCLRLLNELEEDLKQKVQKMTEVLFITDSPRKADTGLPPVADISSPQTYQAGATHQSAEPANRVLFSVHSTTIKPMGGFLRLRISPPPVSMSTKEARNIMEDYIKSSIWFQKGTMEPFVGDNGVPPCAVLLARKGESVYRCFVATKKDGKGKHVHYCIACGFKSKRLHRVIGHQRYKRGHSPFVCPDKGCDFSGYSMECLDDHMVGRTTSRLVRGAASF